MCLPRHAPAFYAGVIDFVVGAIARNYEHEDPLFYEIIDENVEIALDFFKGKIK
jgi:hypothetical protein